MNVGIIVEGGDDVATYPILIKRIDPRVRKVYARECGSRQKLKDKFVVYLKEFSLNPAAFDITRVVVIRDSDCNDPVPIEHELQAILAHSRLRVAFPVAFHATKCKLESWLLADERAINRISYRRGGPGGMSQIGLNLEVHKDTDDLYRATLSNVRLQDTSAVMREIAEQADINIIAQRCPYFREFIQKVRPD
jgi:hypothetical protein